MSSEAEWFNKGFWFGLGLAAVLLALAVGWRLGGVL